MMYLFLQFEIGKIVKYFRTTTSAKIITSLLFLAVFTIVGFGIYAFFVSGLRYINAEATEDTRFALTLFLYELFLIVLSGIIIFSCAVSALFNLFRGEYNTWIIASPSYTLFPRFIFIKSLFNSFLPLIIIFLPAIIAFTNVHQLGFMSLIFISFSVFLLMLLLNAATLVGIITVGFLYYAITKKIKILAFSFKRLLLLLLLIVLVFLVELWSSIKNIDLVQFFKADIDSKSLSITNVSNHFSFLPTHPFAMEILNWQMNQKEQAFINFFILSFFTAVAIFLWWHISRLFYPLWQKFQDGNTVSVLHKTFFTKKIVYHFNGGNLMALFTKELLVSSRNWKSVLWFLFLSSIWLAQIGANVIIAHNIDRYEVDILKKTAILQSLQYIIAIYFISSFTLRFVFPSFSVEKKTSWIVASAPISFKKIFFGRYLFYTLFFVTLGTFMNYVNDRILNLSFTHTMYSLSLFVSAIIFIITLGLSLGALFPNHESDDPEVISTSMPGLFFTSLALIYGALSDLTLYITLTKGDAFWLYFFVVFTFIGVAVLLTRVPKMVKAKAFSSA